MMDDQQGLMETAFLLQAIALQGTDEEKSVVSDAVASSLPPAIVEKYWEHAQELKMHIKETFAKQDEDGDLLTDNG